MADTEREITELRAVGVAGYTVAMELMAKLQDLGVISRDDGASVIDAAIASLERTEAVMPNDAFRAARHILDAQLALWQKDRPE